MSLEALIVTLLIDAVEERGVAVFDVPEAFLQSEFSKEKIMLAKIMGAFVDIMCSVNPEVQKFVI